MAILTKLKRHPKASSEVPIPLVKSLYMFYLGVSMHESAHSGDGLKRLQSIEKRS